ncbi:MAG: N-(5'-phosphoribosyl)anthranilate isomerase [Cyclobacteriaceae bacterium]|nr:N-(5'-phosphoribosyl)anthranilate isomerase [Cyclobacteriaceae bacterium]
MALSTFVYLRNVNNLSDARYAAGMGVDLIGFKLSPLNSESLNPEQFKEIAAWISGVKIVGEFDDMHAEAVAGQLKHYELDYLLIHDVSQLHAFAQLGISLILNVPMDGQSEDQLRSTINYASGTVDYFLLESAQTIFEAEDLASIKAIAHSYPVILGTGITGHNATSIVEDLGLEGISLQGASEIRPGYKEFDEIATILELLEVD